MSTTERFQLPREIMAHPLQPKSLQPRASKHPNIEHLHSQLAHDHMTHSQWDNLRNQGTQASLETGWIRISGGIFFLCFPADSQRPQEKGSLYTHLLHFMGKNPGTQEKEGTINHSTVKSNSPLSCPFWLFPESSNAVNRQCLQKDGGNDKTAIDL